MDEFKLIIAGGRDFHDYNRLARVVQNGLVGPLRGRRVSVVCGMARGADELGRKYALGIRMHVYQFPADWDAHGKRAGHIRNAEMAHFADGLLAFWDGESRGTDNMIQQMKRLGKPVKVVRY